MGGPFLVRASSCCSSLPIKMFAYEGAMRVPMAVP